MNNITKFNKHQYSSACMCTSCEKVNLLNMLQNVKPFYIHETVLGQCFFKCFYKEICNTEKKLDMCGHVINKKIGSVKA